MNNRLLICILFVFISTTLFAQSDSVLTRNIRSLETYNAGHPIEKVHLHLDRQFYFPGDTIWFKAYVVAGAEHRLSALSNLMYAELINPKDSVIARVTLVLKAGNAPGDFTLPYDAASGGYRVRAYTNWMRNFGPEYFFDEPIAVFGFNTSPVSAGDGAISSSGKVDIKFFPEGGELVNGLRSKIAFKATDQKGQAVEVQGSVVDESGNEVATFNSQHLGMGAFPLTPQQGIRYVANVTTTNGDKFTAPLPQAGDAGYTIAVNNRPGDSLYVKVAAQNVTDTAFYLLAQSDGKYYYTTAQKLKSKVFTEAFAKSRFPTGIVQFVLFSQSGEPKNERVVFVQNDDNVHLNMNTDKQTYAPGEATKLNIEARDADKAPLIGIFSVSVVNTGNKIAKDVAENSIDADLLLKSEIGENVLDPGYYFHNPNDKTAADLDLLMLTHNYQRYDWKQILTNNNPDVTFKPEKGFTISGLVTTSAKKPVSNGKVILTSTKSMMVLDTLTDENGRFAFNDLMLADTGKLVINARKVNGSENVILTIDKPSFPAVTPLNDQVRNYALKIFKPNSEQIKQAYASWKKDSLQHVIHLNEVKITDRKIPSYRPNYAVLLKYSPNLNGPGQADQVIMADELIGCDNIALCLAAHIRGRVRITTGADGTPIFYSTRTPISLLPGRTKPMAVMVDGIITDQSIFKNLNASDIQGVEVLASPSYSSIYGSQATGGLLIITMKHGEDAYSTATVEPGLVAFKFKGGYKAHSFYAPKFASANDEILFGHKSTVFWDNTVVTGDNGTQILKYNNPTFKGDYEVDIEGVDVDGRLLKKAISYKVQ